MRALKILLADDHPLMRQGIRSVLENQPGWTVCGDAGNGREAVAMAKRLSPDVAVIDITMPELNGLEAARQIRREMPSVEVLILTMHDSDALIAGALEAGARGCILKSDSARLLIAAVDTVAQRKPFLAGKVAEVVMGRPLKGEVDEEDTVALDHRLSAREREVVQLVAEGRTNKEIATELGVSVKTVDAHRTNIMRRLNVHSVAELVRYAIRNKIIEA
jgi:DNA-binding NarL/FixJ family response regulator